MNDLRFSQNSRKVRLLGRVALGVALFLSTSGCEMTDKFKAAASGTSTTGTSLRKLAFANYPLYDVGIVATGSTTFIRLPISSTGAGDATLTSTENSDSNFSFNGGSFPGTGGTCTQPIRENCSIVILFTAPVTTGLYTDVVTIGYKSQNVSFSISLTLAATVSAAASVTINSAVNYAFGTKNISTSNDATITVLNSGSLGASSLIFSGLSSPLTYKGGTYPGTGGTCATYLASLATCTIVITYAPTSAGATNQVLTLSYGNGATTGSTSINVTGTAVTLASITLTSPLTNPYDYGNNTIGATPATATFTFNNSGGQSATGISVSGLSAPFTYEGGTYPGTSGTCGVTLAAGGSCTIAVTYTPTTAVTSTATITFSYGNGSTTVSTSEGLSGTGVSPASFSISDGGTYDFGSQSVGSVTTKTFTVTNSGGSSGTALTGPVFASSYDYLGGTYPGTSGTCGATLASTASCTIVLSFTPSGAGVLTDTLTLSYNDGTAATSSARALTGTGITVAILTINAAANYDFGTVNVGTSNDTTLTLLNSGGSTATALALSGLIAPITFKGGSFPGTGGSCSTSLGSGASCTLVVNYSPVLAGVTTRTLLVSYHNGTSTTSTSQTVTGTAVSLASISVTSPLTDPFDFGSVTIGAASVDQSFTLSNSGGQSATGLTVTPLSAPFSFKGGTFPGTGGTCAATLASVATCTIVVTFLPTTPVLSTTTLAVSYFDGSSTINLSRAIQGTGANVATLSISNSPSYDYGSKTVGTTTNFTFTLSNSGGTSATGITGAALTAPFSYKGGGAFPGTGGTCTATLSAGVTCTVVLSFAPVAVGGYSDTLSISYNDGINAASTSESLTGTGGSVANLSISDGATYDFNSVVKGYSLTKTFTITNVGSATASAMSGAVLAAPFTYLGGTYPGTGGTCGTTLGSSGTCTVLIKFAPSATGVSSETFTLNYNDSSAATSSTRALTGKGVTLTKIAGGTTHTCALDSSGGIKCWGSGFFGQLGNGMNTNSSTPVWVSGITSAIDLAVGANHGCALLSNGRAYCWGADSSGQLGNDASLTNQDAPVQVASYTDFTQISAGGDTTCGLRTGGTIACWGDDTEGALGNDAGFTSSATPVLVSGLTSITDVSVGRGHSCARKSDNTFACWGSDVYGQLGDGGGNVNSGIPVVPTPGVALSSASGGDVSCALLSDGSVKCWGADDFGELGDDVALSSQISPVTVTGLANVTSIKLGLKHGCALDASNGVLCWGRDTSGQLGDDISYTSQATPVSVTGLTSATSIGVGENHTCAVLNSGLVYCWGANSAGQLGDTGSSNQPTPVLVQGL